MGEPDSGLQIRCQGMPVFRGASDSSLCCLVSKDQERCAGGARCRRWCQLWEQAVRIQQHTGKLEPLFLHQHRLLIWSCSYPFIRDAAQIHRLPLTSTLGTRTPGDGFSPGQLRTNIPRGFAGRQKPDRFFCAAKWGFYVLEMSGFSLKYSKSGAQKAKKNQNPQKTQPLR